MSVAGPGDPDLKSILDEAIYEELLDAASEAPRGSKPSVKGLRRVAAPEPLPEVEEEVDLGPYCVECREDTTGQEGRTERVQPTVIVTGQQDEEGEPEVKTALLKGFLCESCQPFESPLIEGALQTLVERRYDPAELRRKMREMGEEDIWTRWFGPMLDEMEESLGLEVR